MIAYLPAVVAAGLIEGGKTVRFRSRARNRKSSSFTFAQGLREDNRTH